MAADARAVVEVVDDNHEILAWALTFVGEPDLGVVEAIARLQLNARRWGWTVRLRTDDPTLRGLLDLAGLRDVVICVTEAE